MIQIRKPRSTKLRHTVSYICHRGPTYYHAYSRDVSETTGSWYRAAQPSTSYPAPTQPQVTSRTSYTSKILVVSDCWEGWGWGGSTQQLEASRGFQNTAELTHAYNRRMELRGRKVHCVELANTQLCMLQASGKSIAKAKMKGRCRSTADVCRRQEAKT